MRHPAACAATATDSPASTPSQSDKRTLKGDNDRAINNAPQNSGCCSQHLNCPATTQQGFQTFTPEAVKVNLLIALARLSQIPVFPDHLSSAEVVHSPGKASPSATSGLP